MRRQHSFRKRRALLASALAGMGLAFWSAGATAAPVTPVVVADSVAEFSSVQGQDNWYYGYIEPGNPFFQYKYFDPAAMGGDGWWEIWFRQPPWDLLWREGGHPGPNGRWAVRRWISEVDGPIQISGELKDENSNGGYDGVYARIYLNGVEEFSQYLYWAPNTPDPGVTTYSLNLTVAAGDIIDLIIDPALDESYDTTRFTATIASLVHDPHPPGGTVPLPGTVALWGAGVLGLGLGGRVAQRMRRRRGA